MIAIAAFDGCAVKMCSWAANVMKVIQDFLSLSLRFDFRRCCLLYKGAVNQRRAKH